MKNNLVFTFDDFKKNVKDKTLNKFEKMGFQTKVRKHNENLIFKSYISKIINLKKKKRKILEIGPGISTLTNKIIELSRINKNSLYFLDSNEILDSIKDYKFLKKIPGEFPFTKKFNKKHKCSFDIIICYSVLHYILQKSDWKTVLKEMISLLKVHGEIYLGDLPNLNMLTRFLKSEEGIKFHKKNYKVKLNLKKIVNKNNSKINDNVILKILSYCRKRGCNAYLMPQEFNLPLSKRREDIYIKKLF